MHIALLSDIHGNLPALEAVMETAESRGVSRYYCLGDIVGYGPFPVECLELVRKVCTAVIRGNHDSGLVGDTPIEDFNQHGKTAINWTRTVILPEHEEYIRTLPHSVVADGLTLAHASPHNPES